MENDDLEELIAADLTIREIAARLGCSATNVRYWLRRHGLKTTRAARRKSGRTGAARIASRCPKHGDVEFVRRAEGGYRCVRCRMEQVANWRRRVKARLVAEAGGACRVCGYDRCLAALEFHHLDPAEKRFHLSAGGSARSLKLMREEIAKCVLLCSNCHAEVEAGVTVLAA
jgi:hypothetical protein